MPTVERKTELDPIELRPLSGAAPGLDLVSNYNYARYIGKRFKALSTRHIPTSN